VKFDFIASEKAYFDVSFMCRMLDVSESGYYASRTRVPCKRVAEDKKLVERIRAEFAMHKRGCGSRTVVHSLRAQGCRVSRKRVVRLMAQEKLRCRLKRRFVKTTDSKHTQKIAANVLKRDFKPGAPNKVWASDITYIYTKRGWAYLAVVLDVGSRKIVGWDVSVTLEESLVMSALRQAFETRKPACGLIHHSDRGKQYAANEYRELLRVHGAVCSMSRKGNCWDNAVVESFFSTFKRELPNDHVFEDWRQVERFAFAYIDAHYNSQRRHSSLGYLSPNEYERNLTRSAKRLH
jgi:transposase InsO family protein